MQPVILGLAPGGPKQGQQKSGTSDKKWKRDFHYTKTRYNSRAPSRVLAIEKLFQHRNHNSPFSK